MESPEDITASTSTPTPPARPPAFDEAMLRRFLAHVMDEPGVGTTELCILNAERKGGLIVRSEYSGTFSGWFSRADALVAEASRTRTSAYVCLNPAKESIQARSDNTLTRMKTRTKDEEVRCLRWLYIDVDARNPEGTSATDAELAATVAVRDRILEDHPVIRRAAIFGKSGNGAFIMARLPDYPNDPEHNGLVVGAIDSLVARYPADESTKGVDRKTKNAARLCCLPGTLKTKGSHVPARPWRMATLDGEPEFLDDGTRPTLDLRAWLAGNPAPVAAAPARPVVHGGGPGNGRSVMPWEDRNHRVRRAAAYADRMPAAVSGEGGHDATFAVACAMVKGFDLSIGEAAPILDAYNGRCQPPWSPGELAHKLAEANKVPDDRPRGHLFDADRPGWSDAIGGTASHTPYAGPGADFVIRDVIQAVGGGDPSIPSAPPVPPWSSGLPALIPAAPAPVIHAPRDTPALAVEPIRARVAHHLASSRIEDLYRDSDLLKSLGQLEKADRGEAEALKSKLMGISGFKARAFKGAMDGARKPKRDVAHGGGMGAGGMPGAPGGAPAFRPTDMGNADLFLHAHARDACYVKPYNDWMVYDGRRWSEDRTNVALRWAQDVSGQIGEQITPDMADDEVEAVRAWQIKSESKERIAAVLSVAMARVTLTPEEFDQDHMVLNCQNGTLDLETMELRPHDPADHLTKISPVEYDPDAKCPTWDAFVARIMKDDPETVAYLRRIIGYAMTGDVKDHAFFICHGQGGNGKGTFFNTCSYVMGDYATDLDPEIILAQANAMHPTGLTDLEGRRLVVCDETDKKRNIAEALVKRLSGGGRIKARKIGKDYYDFESTHHLFMTTNHLPNIEGNDQGLWRRLKLIPFEATFDRDKGTAPDTDMAVKLRAEASGILNWMLAGLADWKANGLVDCPVVKQATMNLRKDSDILGWFLEEMTVDARDTPDAMVAFKVAYGEYKAWAVENNIKHPLGPKKFGAELNDRGFTTYKVGGVTYKRGLNLRINGRIIPPVAHPAAGIADDGAADDVVHPWPVVAGSVVGFPSMVDGAGPMNATSPGPLVGPSSSPARSAPVAPPSTTVPTLSRPPAVSGGSPVVHDEGVGGPSAYRAMRESMGGGGGGSGASAGGGSGGGGPGKAPPGPGMRFDGSPGREPGDDGDWLTD